MTPTRRGRFGLSVLAIAAAGLAWRVVYVLVWKRPVDACGGPLCGDAIYYHGQAHANAMGRFFEAPFQAGMPAADHPPMTALLLTPVAWVTDGSITAMRLFMAVVGALVVVGIGYLGREVGGPVRGHRIGIVAAAVAAVNANLWLNDGVLMSESIAAGFIVLTLLATYRFARTPTWGWAALLGLACGLTILARAEMALFLPLVVLPVACLARSLPVRQRLGRFLLAGVVAAAALVPWTAFNATRFEKPVLLSTNDGLTLIGANCPDAYGDGIGYWVLTCREPVVATLPAGADQSVESEALRREALSFIRTNWRQLPEVLWVRFQRLWNLYDPNQMVYLNTGEGREAWASWAGVLTADALVLLSLPGGVLLWRRRRLVWPLAATFVIASITALAFYGNARFRLPADIAMCVLGAVALAEGWDRARAWWSARAARRADAREAGGDTGDANPPDGHQPAEPATPELSGGTHYPCLDAYRGIGMTMVLLNHAAYATGYIQRASGPDAPVSQQLLGPIVARTDVAVPMFFVLSAFLLFRPFARAALDGSPAPPVRSFYRRRVLRIFPAYLVALVGVGVIFGLQIASWRGWVANALFLPAVGVPAEVCNGNTCRVAYGITQAWSIGVEVTFYLVLPLLGWVAHRITARLSGRARVAGLLALCGGLYALGTACRLFVVATNPTWAQESLLWLPMFIDIFAVGMAIAVVSAGAAGGHLPSPFRWAGEHPALCWAVVAVGVFGVMSRFSTPAEPFGLNGAEYLPRQLVYGLASGLWLLPSVFGDQRRGRLRAFLSSKVMVYLGAISLSFYLWHLAVIEQVKDWTIENYAHLQELARHPPPDNPLAGVATFQGNFWLVAAISWGLSFLIASLLFRWVELPFLRLKDQPLRDLTRRPPAGRDGPVGHEPVGSEPDPAHGVPSGGR